MPNHLFKIDDEIGYIGAKRVRYGKITGISYNSIYGYDEYVIKWNDDGTIETYDCDLADNRWFKLSVYDPFNFLKGSDGQPLPAGFSTVSSPNISQEVKKECNHEWLWYHGFTYGFHYCRFCDVKKEE